MRSTTEITLISENDHLPKGLIAAISATTSFTPLNNYINTILAKRLFPFNTTDFVIFNLDHTNNAGIEMIDWLICINPKIKIVLIIKEYNSSFFTKAVSIGVRGFLFYSSATSQVLEALEGIVNDEVFISNNILKMMLNEIEIKHNRYCQLIGKLTEREKQICGYLINGLSDRKIGEILCISSHTVNHHLRNLYEKLKVNNRIEAAIKYHCGVNG